LVGAFAIGKMDIDVTGFGRFRRSVPSRRRAMWWRRVARRVGVYAPDMPTVKAAMMTVCVR